MDYISKRFDDVLSHPNIRAASVFNPVSWPVPSNTPTEHEPLAMEQIHSLATHVASHLNSGGD
jgi:hypothetical protein